MLRYGTPNSGWCRLYWAIDWPESQGGNCVRPGRCSTVISLLSSNSTSRYQPNFSRYASVSPTLLLVLILIFLTKEKFGSTNDSKANAYLRCERKKFVSIHITLICVIILYTITHVHYIINIKIRVLLS